MQDLSSRNGVRGREFIATRRARCGGGQLAQEGGGGRWNKTEKHGEFQSGHERLWRPLRGECDHPFKRRRTCALRAKYGGTPHPGGVHQRRRLRALLLSTAATRAASSEVLASLLGRPSAVLFLPHTGGTQEGGVVTAGRKTRQGLPGAIDLDPLQIECSTTESIQNIIPDFLANFVPSKSSISLFDRVERVWRSHKKQCLLLYPLNQGSTALVYRSVEALKARTPNTVRTEVLIEAQHNPVYPTPAVLMAESKEVPEAAPAAGEAAGEGGRDGDRKSGIPIPPAKKGLINLQSFGIQVTVHLRPANTVRSVASGQAHSCVC